MKLFKALMLSLAFACASTKAFEGQFAKSDIFDQVFDKIVTEVKKNPTFVCGLIASLALTKKYGLSFGAGLGTGIAGTIYAPKVIEAVKNIVTSNNGRLLITSGFEHVQKNQDKYLASAVVLAILYGTYKYVANDKKTDKKEDKAAWMQYITNKYVLGTIALNAGAIYYDIQNNNGFYTRKFMEMVAKKTK